MPNLSENRSGQFDLDATNRLLTPLGAEQRIRWALQSISGTAVLSSSFGAQAAVGLHMASQIHPDIPVVLIDTGYLFPETYRFVDDLRDRLNLNLKVYRAEHSAAWQEARHGQRWQQGIAGLDGYNIENKVEPMQKALAELNAGVWFAGLRRSQSRSRADTPIFSQSADGRWKLHPIADWSDNDVNAYMKTHGLPYHPLYEQGYVSIGDTHTTRSVLEVESIEETRFHGLQRECGLHDNRRWRGKISA